MGGLGGGDAARGARGAAAHRPVRPLHLVGFSNGGALAMKYALDAIEDPQLSRPDRLVLISPMIGITRFARFAGLAGLPALLPAFAKAAWLGVVPEFNPFKYNSFPVNGARQSYRLTEALQAQIARAGARGPAGRAAADPDLPVGDRLHRQHARRSSPALYARLPANGSELVLFDLNRAAKFGPLLRGDRRDRAGRASCRRRRAPIARRSSPTPAPAPARWSSSVTEAGATAERTPDLGLAYPPGVFSLSHVALPFPAERFSLRHAARGRPRISASISGPWPPRGERGALITSPDSLLRMSSNPFFPYMIGRIEDGIIAPSAPASG